MKNVILFTYPGNEGFGESLADQLKVPNGEVTFRSFPDGETLVQVTSNVKNKAVIIVCSLYRPDEKVVPLYFLAQTVRGLGARSICLVAPYLAYMRQDKAFQKGQGVSANYFAKLISGTVDSIITVDPHLHRIHSLSEVYTIQNIVVEAAADIANWIKVNISDPVLVGPDSESRQWVSEVAQMASVPFVVLSKIRHGDHDVEIQLPDMEAHKHRTPVLVDDIISTATTMTVAIKHLLEMGLEAPVCIGIHAVFSEETCLHLLDSGAAQVVTCNTIPHTSNKIDLSATVAIGIEKLLNPRN